MNVTATNPMSYYTYSVPSVLILWYGKIQSYGYFLSADEAFAKIKETAERTGAVNGWTIQTPDAKLPIESKSLLP